jgi:hypothetical protein
MVLGIRKVSTCLFLIAVVTIVTVATAATVIVVVVLLLIPLFFCIQPFSLRNILSKTWVLSQMHLLRLVCLVLLRILKVGTFTSSTT